MHPILFHIPIPAIPGVLPQGASVPVFSYGSLIATGFLLTYLYICRLARKRGIDEEHITDLYLVIIITSIAGCRINYVATHWDEYASNWHSIYRLWEGGMVYLGGFIGAMIGGLGYLTFRKVPYGPYYDMFAPAVPFACAIGRIGCFLNGCCFGTVTSGWWGMSFPRVPHLRHPTQLYEFVILMAIAAGLHAFYRRNRRPGLTMVVFMYLYSAERFLIEFIRAESEVEHYIFGLTLAQSTALLVIIVTFAVHLAILRRTRPGPTPDEIAARLEAGEQAERLAAGK